MTRTKVAVPKPAALAEANASSLPRGVKRREDANGAPSYALAGTADQNPYKAHGGSDVHGFNAVLLKHTIKSMWISYKDCDVDEHISAAAAALKAFEPKNEIEGMLSAQAVAMHYGSMECFRRAILPDMPPDIASKLRKDGANLARGVADMLDALDRKRGKGPQVVRVERVVVHEGGQAIVGNVQPAAPKVGEG